MYEKSSIGSEEGPKQNVEMGTISLLDVANCLLNFGYTTHYGGSFVSAVRELSGEEAKCLMLDCGHLKNDKVQIADIYLLEDQNCLIEYYGVDFGRDVEVIEDTLATILKLRTHTRIISGVPKYVQ